MPPSSLSNTSTLVNGQTTLAIEKFSYCTVATKTTKLPWIHQVGRGDLYLVFDNVRMMDVCEQIVEKRLLKVAHKGELLVCSSSNLCASLMSN